MDPDGVLVRVDLAFMTPGASFFVPCLDIAKAKQQAKEMGSCQGFTFVPRAVVEDGLLGIRVWRTS